MWQQFLTRESCVVFERIQLKKIPSYMRLGVVCTPKKKILTYISGIQKGSNAKSYI
jgi:hypothetical protein